MTDQELQEALEKAAEKGAELALRKLTNQVYQDVGRTIIKRFFEALGVLAVAAAIYAANQGWWK